MGTNQFGGRPPIPKALTGGVALACFGSSFGMALSLSLRKAHRTTSPSPRSERRPVYARRRGRVRGYASTACPHANLTTLLFAFLLASQEAAQAFALPTPRSRSLVPCVTTPLYRTLVSRTLRRPLLGRKIWPELRRTPSA